MKERTNIYYFIPLINYAWEKKEKKTGLQKSGILPYMVMNLMIFMSVISEVLTYTYAYALIEWEN